MCKLQHHRALLGSKKTVQLEPTRTKWERILEEMSVEGDDFVENTARALEMSVKSTISFEDAHSRKKLQTCLNNKELISSCSEASLDLINMTFFQNESYQKKNQQKTKKKTKTKKNHTHHT